MRNLLLMLLLLSALPGQSRRIVVGPGEKIRSLRAAVDLARDGDSIILKTGLYREGTITVTKALSIIGEGQPVLDGENKFEIFRLSGNNISIRGLNLRNSGYSAMNDYASIKVVDANHIVLDGNHITGAYFAIHISNTSYITVSNNNISGTPKTEQLTGNGIHLWKSSHALIENNHVQGHRDGIYFEFVTISTIRRNLSENNIRYGLHFMFSNDDHYVQNTFRNNGAGVAVMYSKKVSMEANRFERNWGASSYGILLKDISDSYIAKNEFYRNSIALHMEGTSRIEITGNNFRENGWAVKVQASCENNVFHHNNFTGNSFDVGTNGSISLNDFYNNYWDKYEGYDINKDGVGDIPYRPVSLYSMIIEENPQALILFRSFTVQLLDRAEKAFPGITPGNLTDEKPLMKFIRP